MWIQVVVPYDDGVGVSLYQLLQQPAQLVAPSAVIAAVTIEMITWPMAFHNALFFILLQFFLTLNS